LLFGRDEVIVIYFENEKRYSKRIMLEFLSLIWLIALRNNDICGASIVVSLSVDCGLWTVDCGLGVKKVRKSLTRLTSLVNRKWTSVPVGRGGSVLEQ